MFENVVNKFSLIKKIFSLEKVEIKMWVKDYYDTYRYFNKPHPKYKVIKNKGIGVALLKIPETFDEYLKGKRKQALRTNRNHCIEIGYSFKTINPVEYIDDILKINKSIGIRQNKTMSSDYLDKEKLTAFFSNIHSIYGIFDENKNLKAYAYIQIVGEVCILYRLLGHYEELENGIMYLLVSEIIREIIEFKKVNNYPDWIMYDTYLGGYSGLRYFKERLGFKPYKVKWIWENK